jgi:putative endonuclease
MLPSQRSTQPVGKAGEDEAIIHLENDGYTILERNYHFEKAEVDIVAFDNRKIIFIEVKSRRGISFEESEQRLNSDQLKRIHKAAQAWLYERKMEGSPVRFDLMTVLFANDSVDVNHYKDAFEDIIRPRY